MLRGVFLVLYYGFARKLPSSAQKWAWWARPIRRAICRPLFRQAGRNINIEAGAFFGTGSQIVIGDNSSLGVDAKIYGPLTIGRDVMMGPEVVVITTTHHADRLDVPMIQQGVSAPDPVTIEDDVWIGQRVLILPGVTIGRGSIIAAGAVVSRSIPPYSLAGGVPAKVIRQRQ